MLAQLQQNVSPTGFRPDIRGNPDGKGSSGILTDWQERMPAGVGQKSRRRILAEFFTSMLVLSARFKYQPAIGVANYLYWQDGHWILSLVSPQDWQGKLDDLFAGTCFLHADQTWTMDPSGQLGENNDVSNAVGQFFLAFARMVDTDLSLEETLPFFASELPYNQRLHASLMSRSLLQSMVLSNHDSVKGREWSSELLSIRQSLLAHRAPQGNAERAIRIG